MIHRCAKWMLLVIAMFLLTMPVLAIRDQLPPEDLAGTWTGVLTQTGGVSSVYYFEMELEQNGYAISGTSRIMLVDDPDVYGEFLLEGVIGEDSFEFTELTLLEDASLDYFYWCTKQGTLTLDFSGEIAMLTGPWESDSSCAPGYITLYRLPEHETDSGVVGLYTGMLTDASGDEPFTVTYYDNGAYLLGYKTLGDTTTLEKAVVSDNRLYFYELLAFDLEGPYTILPCARSGVLDIHRDSASVVVEISGEWRGSAVQCGRGELVLQPD